MPPSKVRKEEAELRKIAKQARDTRKQVKAREKKTQQRAAKNAGVVESTTSSAPRKRQAALILPDEVAELRVRMEDGAMASDASKTKKGRTASPAKGKKGASKAAAAAAAAGPSPQTVPEPPYHLEVHFRRKELQIDVTLHKIPESKIDISETNNTQLVVDTTKHTKQWRLALPYPDGVSVDAEAGTYELENGVLHCRLPLIGDIPSHLQEKWDAVIQKMREQRAMRFHVTRDGALTVRTRRALLSKDAGAPAKKASPSEADTAAEDAPATEVKGDAAAGKKNAKAAPAKAAQKRGRDEKEPAATPSANKKQKSETASPAEKRAKVESAGATAVATTSTRTRAAKKPKDGKADVFKQDHERAMAMAKAAATQSKASIRERVQQAIEVQKKRQAKMETREVRKEVKLQRRRESFAKVLQQQKEQLLAQAAMVEAATTRSSAAKKDSGKSVSFAG